MDRAVFERGRIGAPTGGQNQNLRRLQLDLERLGGVCGGQMRFFPSGEKAELAAASVFAAALGSMIRRTPNCTQNYLGVRRDGDAMGHSYCAWDAKGI